MKSTLRVCSRAIASLSEADAGEAALGEARGEAARRAGLACRGRRRPGEADGRRRPGEADGREGDEERAAARANDMAGPALLANDSDQSC